jgi:Zn-dependent M28 family amino/carboxypeptidase
MIFSKKFLGIVTGLVLVALLAWFGSRRYFQVNPSSPQEFDGEQALKDVEYQIALGPRVPESTAHDQIVNWIQSQLKEAGWSVEVQETQRMGHPIQNVVGKWGEGTPWIILGAHYDSRLAADQDPNQEYRSLPVPGANDGASGVAVLLELARALPSHLEKQANAGQIWVVFFDAEDNGNLPGWDWLLGSQAFVDGLNGKPSAVVVVDMIGDKDLNIYQEKNSSRNLIDEIWSQAAELGYSAQFIPKFKFSMIDDHTPFLNAGIPAVDIIDFDYPYWHTRADTPDKVSAQSLKVVGDTLLAWLISHK